MQHSRTQNTPRAQNYRNVCATLPKGRGTSRSEAALRTDGRNEQIAASDDEVEAAKVRDRWAFAFHGRFAYLNFPADFEGKDPSAPEFQALRDQLAEKRRKRQTRKKAKSKGKKGKRKK